MNPTLTEEITIEGNLIGERTAMGVSAEDLAHVMNVLTHQYSDSALAALREIAANARDEHVLLGKPDVPIEVTLPNTFSTDLVIKDYGRGMSKEFIQKKFAFYGASSKRNDKDQVGGFGIGGKAPLAYTDSFTIISVQDGVKGHYIISRDATGAGEVISLPARATDEPNGTEIRIPAKSTNDFDEKAAFLFKFWPENSVLVNGDPPVRHNGIPVGKSLWYSRDAQQSFVVMGGLPYRVANAKNYMPNLSGKYYNSKFHFIAEVPVNSVTITPSREDLEYDDKTVAALKAVGDEFEEKFVAMAKKEILDQPNHVAAYNKWLWWGEQIGAHHFAGMEYKGEKFATTVTVDGKRWKKNAYRYESNIQRITGVAVSDLPKTIFLSGRADDSSYTKSRIRLWANEKGIHFAWVVFTEEKPKCPWVPADQMHVVSWNDIISVKPPRQARAKGIFDIYDKSEYAQEVTADDLKEWDKDLVLISSARARQLNKVMSYIQKGLTTLGRDVTLVKLAETRWAKFRREINDAPDFDTYMADMLKVEAASVPAVTWELKSLSGSSRYMLRKLKSQSIDDPELKKLVDLIGNTTAAKGETTVQVVNNLSTYLSIPVNLAVVGNDWLIANYPLTRAMYYDSVKAEDLIIYLNAAYAARKDS